MGFQKNSLLEQFQKELGRVARKADMYAIRILNEGEEDERRVRELMGLDESLEAAEERVAQTPPDELQGSISRFNQGDIGKTMTNLDALIAISDGIGPDARNEIAAFITAELEPLTTQNLPGYIDQTRVDNERSGYSRNVTEEDSFNLKRQQRARQRRLAGDQRSGPPSTGESFEQGGVPGVLIDQVPPMLTLAGQSIAGGVGRTATGLAQIAGGERAAKPLARGTRALQGQQPIPFPGETAQMGNLTREEKEQIIRQGNMRN
jgi:hypothetical protein